jgi:predicted ATPase
LSTRRTAPKPRTRKPKWEPIVRTAIFDPPPDAPDYPFSLPAIRDLRTLEFTSPVTFLVGENGSGKSTLIEAIAIAAGLNPEGGSRNFNFSTLATHSPLHQYTRLVRGPRRERFGYFARAESFYNVASEIQRLGVSGYGPGRAPVSLHVRSHGEAFIDLMTYRLEPRGFYVFDEPEAALSPARQLACLALIRQLVRQDSQFLIATHSPIIMAYPGATILHLGDEGLQPIQYEDTEHYAVTKEFLNNRGAILQELFRSE